jgi:uncharacterized protein RhaS with RHS repeats
VTFGYPKVIALYYHRARYYDPQARQFISEDPIGLGGGINLYAYVGNNPINSTDPSGTCETLKGCINIAMDAVGAVAEDVAFAGELVLADVGDWIELPRDPGCVAQWTTAGAAIGTTVGMVGGAVGVGVAGGAAAGTAGSVVPVLGTGAGLVSGAVAGGAVGAAKGGVEGGLIGTGAGAVGGFIMCAKDFGQVGKTGRKINQKRYEVAKDQEEKLRRELKTLKDTINKDAAIKDAIAQKEAEINRLLDRMRKSPPDARVGQHP